MKTIRTRILFTLVLAAGFVTLPLGAPSASAS